MSYAPSEDPTPALRPDAPPARELPAGRPQLRAPIQPSGPLDEFLNGVTPGDVIDTWLDRFLSAETNTAALAIWVGRQPGLGEQSTPDRVARLISRDLARLDQLLSGQVNAILHHPRFQQLEAAWRGVWYLTGEAEEAKLRADQDGHEAKVKVRILSVSKRELRKDVEKAVEFDQSQIFRKVYEEEFGMAGGEPYGVLLGDYQFTNHIEDIELLGKLSEVAAAAFAPLIASPAPQLLGLDSFEMLQQPINLPATFNHLDYLKWRSLREREESRFMGLTLPNILMRLPYENDGARVDGFRFREEVEGPDRSKYLWGSSAFAFGAVLMRAFATSGWFADIRGAQRGIEGGGVVTGLPVHSFSTERRGIAPKISTEIAIPEDQECQLAALGFIPLCHATDTELSVFSTNQSIEKPKLYDDKAATANARISAMLQYTLCASRFAHYLKILARNKIGSEMSEQELHTYLNNWINEYVAADERAPLATKAKYPLREASVQVREVPGQPGNYRLIIHLLPHFQLDELTANLRLVTRLTPPTTAT